MTKEEKRRKKREYYLRVKDTEEFKATRKKYLQSESYKNSDKKYRTSERGRITVKRVRKTYLENGGNELATDAFLKRLYGITLSKYNEILKEQNYVCDICKQPQRNKRLSVDHNHETGKVRGLLCDNCNWLVGHSKENIETLENAKLYLNKHKVLD